jgi:hypothetical protein
MLTVVHYQEDYNVTASSGRYDVWQRGLEMMYQNPLLGVGMEGFGTAEGMAHGGTGKWSTAHNSFVQFGAEQGVIALILFIKLLAESIKSLRQLQQSPKYVIVPRWFLDGTEVSIYAYIVTGFFLSQAYSTVLYILIAFSIIAIKLQQSHHNMNSTNS